MALATMTLTTVSLDTITSCIDARAIHPHGVTALASKMATLGYLPQFPILVTTADDVQYRLLDGAHRVAAAKKAQLTEVSALVRAPCATFLEEVALARASNEASGTNVITTLIDDATLVWRLCQDYTQAQVGEALGWSREQVKDYVSLEKIDRAAWDIIGATFEEPAFEDDEDAAPRRGAFAPKSDFTEGLLRLILALTPAQQLDLVTRLAKGKDGKGHPYSKKDFRREAERYAAHNALRSKVTDDLAHIPEDHRATYSDLMTRELTTNRAYVDEWLVKKAPGDRYAKLLQAQLDAYEQKTHIRVFCRAIEDVSAADVPDESIDVLMTDPPYERQAVAHFAALGQLAARVIRPGGSLIVLCGQSYLPAYLDALSAFLTYRWTLACHMPGGQAAQIWQAQVNTFWKPALWFVREPFPASKWVSDHFSTPTNSNDKRFHKWGQSEHIMRELIERFTTPGEVLYDPFLGGGTTGIVAKTLGRKFIGSDISETEVKQALTRIHGEGN